MNRRIIAMLGVATVTAALVLGTGTAAFGATVTGTVGGLTYSADNTDVAAGATVTGYTSPGDAAVIIPGSVSIGGTSYPVAAVGANAFQGDPYMTSVVVGPSVTSIGVAAFANGRMTSAVISNSVTTIGMSAFSTDPFLASVTIGDSVTSIGSLAFANDGLTSVTIPDSVTTIGPQAFFSNSLTSVTFGNSLTSIGNNAFAFDRLTSVTFPASVTSIGSSAFDESNFLASATFLGAAPTTFVGTSLGSGGGLTVYYNLAYDASQVAGGFTTPTWIGYNTVKQAAVTFDLDGHGGAVAPQNLRIGVAPTQPTDPTAPGVIFTGWYTSPALTTRFDFADPITANTTVYAGWASLALTGVDVDPLAAPVGTGATVLGILFLVVAARRRSRSRALAR